MLRGLFSSAIAITTTMALVGCAGLGGSSTGGGGDDDNGSGSGSGSGSDQGSGSGSGSGDEWQQRLDQRQYNYPAALRTASLRLTGDLPTVAQVEQLAGATDMKAAYEALITGMLTDARFTRQMLGFWRDTFKMGGAADLDGAPAFATQLTVGNLSSDQLFIATTGTCPTVSGTTITAGNCATARRLPPVVSRIPA